MKLTVETLVKLPCPAEIHLEELKEDESWQELDSMTSGRLVRIYSYQHNAYWRPDGKGYVTDGLAAGVFLLGAAYDLTKHCGPEKRITFRLAV